MSDQSRIRAPRVFDSHQRQVGESYARALLGLAKSGQAADSLIGELGQFAEAVRGLPRFSAAMESPRVSESAKLSMVAKALDGRCSTEFSNFVKVLVRRGRFDCLEAILASATRLRDESAGRLRGVVTAAAAMDADALGKLASNLSRRLGREVVLTADIDEAIIGGVIVRVGDTVYDASVRNQLKQLKARAAKSAGDRIRSQLDRFASGV